MGELYRLDFASGRSYIGITRKTAALRFKGHIKAAGNSSKGIIYQAWRKHGQPMMTILAVVGDKDLPDTERRAIAVFGTLTPGGYNLIPGGDIPPSLTPSVAAKIAAALRGRKIPEEQCRRQSERLRGRKHSAETIAKMSMVQRGKKISLIAKARMSGAAKRRKASPETRAKMAVAQQARRRTEGFAPQRPRVNYPRRPKIGRQCDLF